MSDPLPTSLPEAVADTAAEAARLLADRNAANNTPQMEAAAAAKQEAVADAKIDADIAKGDAAAEEEDDA